MKLSVISKVVVSSLFLMSAVGVANAHKGHVDYKDHGYKDAVFKDQPCLSCLKDGFYVGAEAGYDAFRIRQSISSDGFSSSYVNSVTGWTGGLFVGYGQYFDNFYLAGELLGNYNGNSQNVINVSDADGNFLNQSIKAKGTWGISILPGMKINNSVLGFLRLGYDWTKFESSVSFHDSFDGVDFSTSQSNTRGGFDAGIGMETCAWDNWSLRTEYNHIWYSSGNFGADSAGSYNASDNQFDLGLVYHIA